MTAHTPAASRSGILALVEVWHQAAGDVVALLRSLPEDDWSRPTDLPGWDVRAVAAHLAHLESLLAGGSQDEVDVADASRLGTISSRFTEVGVLARAGWPTEVVLDELESSVAARHAALLADPPPDPEATAPGFTGALGWTWERLLSNRSVDLWMHEQDIRRAVGRPGNLDSPAARHTAAVFAAALPYVLGRKVRPEPGVTVVVEVTGPLPQVHAATVGEDGRGAAVAPPDDPTVRITVDLETWVVLCGGRRPPGSVDIRLSGDEQLGRRAVAALAVTP